MAELSTTILFALILVAFIIGPLAALGIFLAPLHYLSIWFPPALIAFLYVPIYAIPAGAYLIMYPLTVSHAIKDHVENPKTRNSLYIWHCVSWTATLGFITA